jgi:hypothetical protein
VFASLSCFVMALLGIDGLCFSRWWTCMFYAIPNSIFSVSQGQPFLEELSVEGTGWCGCRANFF